MSPRVSCQLWSRTRPGTGKGLALVPPRKPLAISRGADTPSTAVKKEVGLTRGWRVRSVWKRERERERERQKRSEAGEESMKERYRQRYQDVGIKRSSILLSPARSHFQWPFLQEHSTLGRLRKLWFSERTKTIKEVHYGVPKCGPMCEALEHQCWNPMCEFLEHPSVEPQCGPMRAAQIGPPFKHTLVLCWSTLWVVVPDSRSLWEIYYLLITIWEYEALGLACAQLWDEKKLNTCLISWTFGLRNTWKDLQTPLSLWNRAGN